MSTESIISLVISALGIIFGGGGLFAYLSARAQNKVNERSSSVAEWKDLYDEMKARLDSQEEENEELRAKVAELIREIDSLREEIRNYKKYDKYMSKLEAYVETLLSAIKPMISEESYNSLIEKKPEKEPDIHHVKSKTLS